MSKIINLPDTPLNRRLIEKWRNQDSDGDLVKRQLFNKEDGQPPATPDPVDPLTYTSADRTLVIEEGDAGEGQPVPPALYHIAIEKMVGGAAGCPFQSSETIFLSAINTINLKDELPLLYEQKKNKCASIPSLCTFIKKNESFKWPSNEIGLDMRATLAKLLAMLQSEYPTSTLVTAAVQTYALHLSKHSPIALSVFHEYMTLDEAFLDEFDQRTARGSLTGADLPNVPAVNLPGFARLSSGEMRVGEWLRVATAQCNVISYANIAQLEEVYHTAHKAWVQFKVEDKEPKLVKTAENTLFVKLQSSAEAAGLHPPTPIDRAQHLLATVKMQVQKSGQVVSAKQFMIDLAAELKLGTVGVTRAWILEVYEKLFEIRAHHPVAAARQQPTQTPGDLQDIKFNCRDCGCETVFTVGEQSFYISKGMKSKPSRCKRCQDKYKAEASKTPCKEFQATGTCRYGDSCRNLHAAPDRAFVTNSSKIADDDVEAEVITCQDCSAKFELNAERKKWYKDKNFEKPKRCQDCRSKRKMNASTAFFTESEGISIDDDVFFINDDGPMQRGFTNEDAPTAKAPYFVSWT